MSGLYYLAIGMLWAGVEETGSDPIVYIVVVLLWPIPVLYRLGKILGKILPQ